MTTFCPKSNTCILLNAKKHESCYNRIWKQPCQDYRCSKTLLHSDAVYYCRWKQTSTLHHLQKENVTKGIYTIRDSRESIIRGLDINKTGMDWLETVWERRPGALIQCKSLLILDSFPVRLAEAVKEKMKHMKSGPVIIPEGLTSILQPLYVNINKLFKNNIQCLYTEWMALSNHQLTR